MKNFLFGTLVAGGMLFASSCSNEGDVVTPTNGEATVAISLDIPQMQMASRAFSDGTTAKSLQYAIYDIKESDKVLVEGLSAIATPEEINIKTTIEKKLRSGHTYEIVFWASAGNASPYSVDFGATGDVKMTANYSANNSTNSDVLDAFYGHVEPFTVNGDMTINATLARPFAQINIGTNDLEIAGEKEVKTKITAKGVYTEMNLMTGTVTGTTSDVELSETVKPEGETFPVNGYEYLAMGYFLVDKEKALINIDFDINIAGSDVDKRRVSNVPVQRNWKTNIYGKLLSSDVDVMVEVIPDFDEGYNHPFPDNSGD